MASELPHTRPGGLSPAPIRKVLLLVSKRADKIAEPLAAVGVSSEVIIGSKWSIVPKVLAREDAIRAANVDVVIADCCGTHVSMAMMLRRLLGVPAVYRMRGNMWQEYQDKFADRDDFHARRLVNALTAYTNYNLPHLDAIMPVAQHMADAVRAELPELRTPVMPVPIAVNALPGPPDDLDETRRRWAPDGRGIVASITNFRYWQKAAPMLEAAPALAETLREHGLVWAIAGRGAFAGRFFDELAQRCPPENWVRVGYIADVSALLYTASAFLHLSEMDGLPNVIMEAQMCGCPVIANDYFAMAEMVSSEHTGLLVDTPAQAAEGLERLLGDATLRERVVAEGRRDVQERHTNEAVGSEFVRALGEVKAAFERRTHA